MSELGERSEAVWEKRKRKKFTAFLNSLAGWDTGQSGTGDSWRLVEASAALWCAAVPRGGISAKAASGPMNNGCLTSSNVCIKEITGTGTGTQLIAVFDLPMDRYSSVHHSN